jgi:hypothetical protein
MSVLSDLVNEFVTNFHLPRGYYMSQQLDTTGTADVFNTLILPNDSSGSDQEAGFFGLDMRMIFIVMSGDIVTNQTIDTILQTISQQFQKFQIHFYLWVGTGAPDDPPGNPQGIIDVCLELQGFGINVTYQGELDDDSDLNSLYIIQKTFFTPFTNVDPDNDGNQNQIPV